MITQYLKVEKSFPLEGTAYVSGAKNAVLVIICSLLLTRGKSHLYNVPCSADVLLLIELLETLGAQTTFDRHNNHLMVDTTHADGWHVPADIMQKMRASILVLGPLLARCGKAQVAAPGGDNIGKRPIDYHLDNFRKMGAIIEDTYDGLFARATQLAAHRVVLEYPSVGATENILMAATLTTGTTTIINAALEPEVLDLIEVLTKMGAQIVINAPATLVITGVQELKAVEHTIMPDRLEAGTLLLASAITNGDVLLPNMPAHLLDVFLLKLEQMGYPISIGTDAIGIRIKPAHRRVAVSFKTGPYPNFATDLQSPMMAAQLVAQGTAVIEETVFENRLQHAYELAKLGAHITVEYNRATIIGGFPLVGTTVVAGDIRASCSLALAGLVAEGTTIIEGVAHWRRGYENLEKKLSALGAPISIVETKDYVHTTPRDVSKEYNL